MSNYTAIYIHSRFDLSQLLAVFERYYSTAYFQQNSIETLDFYKNHAFCVPTMEPTFLVPVVPSKTV